MAGGVCGKKLERRFKKKIPFLFLIGGGVFGVQPLISSKCCSGAEKKDCNLEKYLDPHTLHHSPLRGENEFRGSFERNI